MVDWGGIEVKELTQSQKDILLSLPGSFENILVNGDFRFAQRQDPNALTTYSALGTGAPYWKYAADRWAMANENASLQYIRFDTRSFPEAGLTAQYYGRLKKITNAGKILVMQILELRDSVSLRGRKVRFHVKMKYSVAASMNVRLGLLYTPGFGGDPDRITNGISLLSAWGAVGVDPTWTGGGQLTALAPSVPQGGFVNGLGMDCILTNGWVRYSAVFDLPAGVCNVIPVIWSNGQLAVNDELNISEAMLTLGEGIPIYIPQAEQVELSRAQRYYAKSFPVDSKPRQASGDVTTPFYLGRFLATFLFGTHSRSSYCAFPVRMRQDALLAAPVVTAYNPVNANAQAYNRDKAADASLTAHDDSINGISFTLDPPVGTDLFDAMIIHWSADADMSA